MEGLDEYVSATLELDQPRAAAGRDRDGGITVPKPAH